MYFPFTVSSYVLLGLCDVKLLSILSFSPCPFPAAHIYLYFIKVAALNFLVSSAFDPRFLHFTYISF
jgi:hypothetical protein